jgi:hypothetical protein
MASPKHLPAPLINLGSVHAIACPPFSLSSPLSRLHSIHWWWEGTHVLRGACLLKFKVRSFLRQFLLFNAVFHWFSTAPTSVASIPGPDSQFLDPSARMRYVDGELANNAASAPRSVPLPAHMRPISKDAILAATSGAVGSLEDYFTKPVIPCEVAS